LVTLAQVINDVSDFKSEIIVKNTGLNLEYTSSNDRLIGEYLFYLSTNTETIAYFMAYYRSILQQIYADEIRGDALAQKIVIAKV
jgi:GDP-L-fucose synthase